MGLFQITAVPQNWVTQCAICGHDIQTFTSEQTSSHLGYFQTSESMKFLAMFWGFSCPHTPGKNLRTTRACGQQSCLIGGHAEVTINWGREKSGSKAHWINPYAFLPALHHICADDTRLDNSGLDSVYRSLQVHSNLITRQTDMDSDEELPSWVTLNDCP